MLRRPHDSIPIALCSTQEGLGIRLYLRAKRPPRCNRAPST